MAYQSTLPFFDFSEAVTSFANGNNEERGAVFTKSEVVEFILDLAGYTVDFPLHNFRILEPSCGHGEFLLPAVKRLLTSYKEHLKDRSFIIEDLSKAILAVEVNKVSIKHTRDKLLELLRYHGIPEIEADNLVNAWIIEGDFLLADLPHTFTHAVGNPPYLRQELIPDILMNEYRTRYRTIYDRADLYIPFIERCLTNLTPGGTLGFICSDRWMKNKYGGPLRAMIAKDYRLMCYVYMVDTPAFHSDVTAYPAVTIIKKEKPGPTRIAHRPEINKQSLETLVATMNLDVLPEKSNVIEVTGIMKDSEPWILRLFDRLSVVRRLESDFPALEDVGCKVGIGVATGADKVFIGRFEDLDVEPDRKLPLATTKDIENGIVEWRGLGVINPFSDSGSLVDLALYPKLARYLEDHAPIIRKRNCAKQNPKSWYRTIDRIYPGLANSKKLLIPDIKGNAHIVYEYGQLYPHHNLYYITSEEWDLKALQAVLLSGIANLFVSLYSTQMRGGYLRFQAQYLRKIRLPRWEDVSVELRRVLLDAAQSGHWAECNDAVYDLYQLTPNEKTVLRNIFTQEHR